MRLLKSIFFAGMITCLLQAVLDAAQAKKVPVATIQPVARPRNIEQIIAQPVSMPSPVICPKQIAWKHADRKKIIIFSSIGGGGHTSAAQALKSYLGDAYELEIVNILSEVLQDIDPIRRFTESSGEGIYNYFLQNQMTGMAGGLTAFGKLTAHFSERGVVERIEAFLKVNKPDAVISIMPFINSATYVATQKFGLPFAVIPLDLDVTNYWTDRSVPCSSRFVFGIPLEDSLIRDKLKEMTIPESRIRIIGFPVRKDFLEKRHNMPRKEEADKIMQDYAIPADKKIIMILMGAAGSKATLDYVKALTQVKESVHLLILVGKNEDLRLEIKKISFPDHVSVSIIGFTQQVADFMSIADLLITKPGPTSIFEAIYVGVPFVLDVTQTVLWWEQMNIEFVKKHQLGEIITDMKTLPEVITRNLAPDFGNTMRKRLQQFQLPDVVQNVKKLVQEMLLPT